MKMIKTFYAVRKGRKNNVVVKSWPECEALVKGYPGAIYKGFGLYQKEEAKKFAQSGDYGKHTPKVKPKKTTNSQWNNDLYPCVERKDYRDTLTGVFYKNRCIMRKGPTTTGEDYKPHIGNSCPFG